MAMQIITITDDLNHAQTIDESLRGTAYDVIANANVDDCWVEQAHTKRPDMIIFVLDEPTDRLLNKIRDFSRDYLIPIVMFADNGNEATIASSLQAGVISYIVKGLSKDRIKAVLAAARIRFKEYHLLRAELNQANIRLQERKVIERAKGVLMKTRGYGEDDAYSALRTLAMKKNRKLAEIAENVINTSELLS